MKYVDIILPNAGLAFYTYHASGEMLRRLRVGCAVEVQFLKRMYVGGIVREIHDRAPAFATKPVKRILFDDPLVSPVQMKLWEWMAQYYMCSPGEVMLAALPALLKPTGFSQEEFESDQYKPTMARFVALSPQMATRETFNEVCEGMRRRAPKQYEAMVEIASREGLVARSQLRADNGTLRILRDKGLITIESREANYELRITNYEMPQLSPAQEEALRRLRESFRTHRTSLLFGVPSSGKSEICFHAIAGTLARGRDVLLLLPEIALTTQFVGRVRGVFGEQVVLYHSGLSDKRRAEAYVRLARSEGGSLIVGARSAVFLPMPRLGLVVIDEEQDGSYKQSDPAPRYNARDTAIMLAGLHDARVILASATPSLETWANAASGRYGLVELTERWGGTQPPEVIISDTLRAAKRGERRSHFNKDLLDRMTAALERREQIILFQNRRGVAPMQECDDCGHVSRCAHCGIPMTLHKTTLRCHYCGSWHPATPVCPACGSDRQMARGFGTEKIEDELAALFPNARIDRLDGDSVASEKSYKRVIGDFEARATDILVGTQMVTKGLDFAGVSLVGVLNADNLVNHPDFRASERAYSLLAQVAGRAGRRERRGEVVIQTASPGSRLIAQAAAGDYRAMAADLLAERAMYGYPPSSRLVSVMLRHTDRQMLDRAAARLKGLMGEFEDRLLGPQPPVTERIKGEFALVFLLKVPRSLAMSTVRQKLQTAVEILLRESRQTTVTINVDPQ